jgi:hypothetical protein
VDWDNPQLVASGFYPDDLPADWHLTYYANYIMACVLSPEKWLNASIGDIADWCDQTQENFWFYLLCDSVEQFEQAQQCASNFPGKMAGCVLSFSMDDVLVSDWPLLRVGTEVFSYDYAQLREAKPLLMAWLDSDRAHSHALVLMSASKADQVKAVQTLLELLGVGR